MKKLLILMIALIMTLSLAACGGSKVTSAESPSTPSQVKEAEFTAEQKVLAQEFSDMTEMFNKAVDMVNASPELLSDEELITTMNELANEISIADEYFASPETLTPEVVGALKVAIELTHAFITEAEADLDAIEGAKANSETETVIVPVEIFNIIGVDIHTLALSPANSNEWGENLITEVIQDGEKVQGELAFTEDTLVWDILVQDDSENQFTFMGVDFSDASTDGAKLILEATEGGEYFASVN